MKNKIKVIFVNSDGNKQECYGIEGESILTVAHNNNIDLEGACEGSLACSTCHVIIDQDWYQKTPQLQEILDDENDMLDLAYGLSETSRLGCQVTLTKELDGIILYLPNETRNIKQ